MKRDNHLIVPRHMPKSSHRPFKVAIIVFLNFHLLYMVDVAAYTPTLRYSTGDGMPIIQDPNLKGDWKLFTNTTLGLVGFDGRGNYSFPEFTWIDSVGPTAIEFYHSKKLGTQYENDMFVSDVHEGRIYHFQLSRDRTELILSSPLEDKIANTTSELKNVIFAEGFGGITDLEVGPDGHLYIVSIGQGKIFRILPKS